MSSEREPVFSVLLPTHNRSEVLALSLSSVLAQTFKEFEILVVADGCTDDTDSVVAAFAAKDSRVRYFSYPKGPGFGYENRNAALAHARGRLIAFAAHDDLWFPDHLSAFSEYFENNTAAHLAYSRPLWIHPDGTFVPSVFNTDAASINAVFMNVHNEIPANCVVHTQESLRSVNSWDSSLPNSADWDLWKRILQAHTTPEIGFITTPTTIHFRAHWRSDENSFPAQIRFTYEFIKKRAEFATKLCFPVEQGKLLQQTIFPYLFESGWSVKFRKELFAIIDANLYDLASNQLSAAEQTAAIKGENVRLRAELDAVRNSRTFKLAATARKFYRRFFPNN